MSYWMLLKYQDIWVIIVLDESRIKCGSTEYSVGMKFSKSALTVKLMRIRKVNFI